MADREDRVWTAEELTELRRSARLCAATFDLHRLAERFDRPALQVNRALDALLGRSPGEAALALDIARPQTSAGGVGAGLRAFLKGMLP